MLLRVAAFSFVLTASLAAHAETDWSIAARTWSEQLQELRTADAARRLCGVPANAATVSALRTTVRGLEQALRPTVKSDGAGGASPQAVANRSKFCADTAALARAKATLASIAATTQDEAPPRPAAAAPSASAPTPVIDPDIPLIRGCRGAVNRALGAKRTDNKVFWAKYEACITAQGAGWY